MRTLSPTISNAYAETLFHYPFLTPFQTLFLNQFWSHPSRITTTAHINAEVPRFRPALLSLILGLNPLHFSTRFHAAPLTLLETLYGYDIMVQADPVHP